MAEDIAQKAFVIALQNINSFDASHSFLLWIRGIVRNVARHEWKSLARHSKIERDNLAEYVEHLANNPSALENLENIEQRRQALKQCLDKLPAHGRKIVHLHYTMGVSCAEAALQTGTTLSAVKMALVRIRQALRQCAQARLAGGE
jgi:RNA polymerase sigma-70 factor (ECF subfamily)